MTTSFIFLLSAALPMSMAIYRHRTSHQWLLLISTALYFLFCIIAFGRLIEMIPTQSIEEIANQHGFDCNSLPISIAALISLAQITTIIFNQFCTYWIWRGYGFWSWFLFCVGIFFLAGGFAAIAIGVNPILVWFGACCGIMAMAGWVLGLSYIEFCVIGNIWLPALAIIASSLSMMVSIRKNGMILKAICWGYGFVQIIAMLILLSHYWGSMDHAFYLCVHDLRSLAHTFHTTYEIVNLIVYFPLFILPLLINLFISHRFKSFAKKRANCDKLLLITS